MGIVNGVAGSAINASATVTPDGEEIAEGESENPIQSIENDLATIRDGAIVNTDIRSAAGDPDDACGGTYKLYGEIQLLDNGSSVGAIRLGANTQIVADDVTAYVRTKCHKITSRDRVTVPDSGSWPKTFGTSDGDRFRLAGNPASDRVVLLDTTDSPVQGERITFTFFSVGEGSSQHDRYTFKQGANTVAIFRTSGGVSTTSRLYDATFIWDDDPTSPGTDIWLLEASSGIALDDAGNEYGVIAVRA